MGLIKRAPIKAIPQETADISVVLQKMDVLVSAIELLAQNLGTRLTREQLAQRLGIHRHTLRERLKSDRRMPRPGPDGRWLLSEIVQWEQGQQQ